MKHPIQKLYKDSNDIHRFVENPIVRYLLDAGPFDMNDLAIRFHGDEHREDAEQFAQLIGYSLGGFSELSYVSDEAYKAAYKAAFGEKEEVSEKTGGAMPCAFCGGTKTEEVMNDSLRSLECLNCHAQGPYVEDVLECPIEAWNSRYKEICT